MIPPGSQEVGASAPALTRRNRGWRVVTTILGITGAGLSSYYVVSKLVASLRQLTEFQVRIRPWPLVVSFAATLLCVLLGGTIWHLVLSGVGARPEWRHSLRSHLMANIANYLPGYGWQLAGKAYLTQRGGIPVRLVSYAIIIEFAASAITRGVIALTTMPQSTLVVAGWDSIVPHLPWMRIGAWCLLLSSPLLLHRTSSWIGRRNPGATNPLSINKGALWLALTIMSFTWLLYGVGFAFLLHSLYDIALHQVVGVVFSTTTSFLVSLLMFFVPAGIGVRESVVIYTLEPTFPAAIVTVSALASRVVLLLAELLGALMGSCMGLRSRLR